MRMITKWVTRIVLHMSDQHIMPVGNIQRTIRSKFKIDRPEVIVRLYEQILSVPAFITGAFVGKRMLLGSQETNGIVDQEIALHLIWEMATGYKFQPRGRSHTVIRFDQAPRRVGVNTIARFYRSRHHPTDIWTGSFRIEILSPFIEGNAPRIEGIRL